MLIQTLLFFSPICFANTANTTAVDYKKNSNYISSGVFFGGSKDVTHTDLSDIRWAQNTGFERLVFDFSSAQSPYFQVAVEPDLKRITVTFWSKISTEWSAKKIALKTLKSKMIQSVNVYPGVDDDLLVLSINLRAAIPTEVFSLSAPNRVIVDMRSVQKFVTELSSKEN